MAGMVGVALLVSAVALAKDAAPKKGGATATSSRRATPRGDVPERAGVKLAVVQGDPSKGAGHFFVKLPAGYSVPLHHHSADHYVTVVSGTAVFNVDGGEHTLPAGSYFAFSGKKKHTTHCNDGADCVLFVDCRGKWDVVEEPAAK
jgi:quercetin dioxygenase-like cupin family protein